MSTLQIELDKATDDALTTLASAQGKTPADLVAEMVAHYVKIYEPLPTGHEATPRPADPDPLGALLVERLGWDPDDPRIVNRRRDPLDVLVGSLDIDPVDDIDEVIYGR